MAEDAPTQAQLTRALNVLQKKADEQGVIRGGSLTQIIKQRMGLTESRAKGLSQQLGLLGFRSSTHRGSHHTHLITLKVTEVTEEDMIRLTELQAAAKAAKDNPSSDVDKLLAVIDRLEKRNTQLEQELARYARSGERVKEVLSRYDMR